MAFVDREKQTFSRYAELFPNYEWTDSATAIDLMAAEIRCLRSELLDACRLATSLREVANAGRTSYRTNAEWDVWKKLGARLTKLLIEIRARWYSGTFSDTDATEPELKDPRDERLRELVVALNEANTTYLKEYWARRTAESERDETQKSCDARDAVIKELNQTGKAEASPKFLSTETGLTGEEGTGDRFAVPGENKNLQPLSCNCTPNPTLRQICDQRSSFMKRDPRRNPRVGDVLRRNGKDRRIINILPGFCPNVTYMSGRRQGSILLPNWHKWAKDSEVIHYA
jgi:hypothetical protein